jgi:transposase
MMPTQVSLFPPVLGDPIRAAEAVSGKGIYVTIGDQIEQLLADVELARLDPAGVQSSSTLAVLALVTVFQFAEGLPDRQAAEATRTRPHWKYALHLTRTYPGLDHRLLCKFRQTLLCDRVAQQVLQHVLDRLAGTDLLSGADRRSITVGEVLAAVCRVSRLEQLIETMHMVLEAVAAVEPESLRTITLPHWYERYSQMQVARDLPRSKEDQISWARAIGADAAYLLEAIAGTGNKLISLPEARSLQQVWACQFESAESPPHWHTPVCAACCLR